MMAKSGASGEVGRYIQPSSFFAVASNQWLLFDATFYQGQRMDINICISSVYMTFAIKHLDTGEGRV